MGEGWEWRYFVYFSNEDIFLEEKQFLRGSLDHFGRGNGIMAWQFPGDLFVSWTTLKSDISKAKFCYLRNVNQVNFIANSFQICPVLTFAFHLAFLYLLYFSISLFWGTWMRSLIFELLFSLNRPLMLFARRKLRSSWLKTFLVARFPPRAAWRLPRRPWTAAAAKRP